MTSPDTDQDSASPSENVNDISDLLRQGVRKTQALHQLTNKFAVRSLISHPPVRYLPSSFCVYFDSVYTYVPRTLYTIHIRQHVRRGNTFIDYGRLA